MKDASVILLARSLERGPPEAPAAQGRGHLFYAQSISQGNVIVAKLIPHNFQTRGGMDR
jgi:hypothetical protein